jgi:rubrerythrin
MFYLKHAQASEDRDVRELFRKLAADEEEHYQKIQDLTEELKEGSDNADYLYDEEVSSYFNSLVEFTVFPPLDSKESIEALDDINKALKLAVRAEKDAILFYREMCANNSGKTIEAVERLIKEKKENLQSLAKYIKKYGSK